MQRHDLLTGVSLGEPHEPVGLITVRRLETLGKFDGKRFPILTAYRLEAVVDLPRADHQALVERALSAQGRGATNCNRLSLLVDITRAGRAVLPLMRARGLRPVPITINTTIGAKPTRDAYQLGRPELITVLSILIAEGRIDASGVPNAKALEHQLMTFTTAKRPGPSDNQKDNRQDLVTALAMALWWSEKRLTPLTLQPVPPAVPIDCRPPTFDQMVKASRRA